MDIKALIDLYVDAWNTWSVSYSCYDEYLSMADSAIAELSNGVYADVVKFIDGVFAEALSNFPSDEAKANFPLKFGLLYHLQQHLIKFSANQSVKIKILEYFDIVLERTLCQFYAISGETFKALWKVRSISSPDIFDMTSVDTYLGKNAPSNLDLFDRLVHFDYMMNGIRVYNDINNPDRA